ncbi:MAG: HD-GYP domain-containing protein [Gemmataceae bacterium]
MASPVQPVNGQHLERWQQARAAGLILRTEFDTPFTFFDPVTGAIVATEDGAPDDAAVPPVTIIGLVASGAARVVRSGRRAYRLLLVLYLGGEPTLVGAAEVPALASDEPQASCERTRLEKWLQAVSDRLRLADAEPLRRRPRPVEARAVRGEEPSGGAIAPWEALLALDGLIRRLRIHKDPEKNQRRILETAAAQVGMQGIVWVPRSPDATILCHGDVGLAPCDCRQLAAHLARSPEMQTGTPLLCNQVQQTSWGGRFPSVATVLAFQIHDPHAAGWVIALNKRAADAAYPGGTAAFRKSDAALLTPFVALLELYARGSNRYQELKDLLVGLTRSLTAALDAKDPYTYGHSERVARIAVELGREMGLGEDELGDIYLAGLLHDVGKIGIRDAVLCKEGPLTPEEFEHVKQHVNIGYTILSELRQIRNLLPGVLHHHERYDGSGYPDGLEGDSIPLMARILAVADAYDAMSTTRPYRDALACRRVEEVLSGGAGSQWDRRVVEAFMKIRQRVHAIRQRGVGESLRLAIDGALRTVVTPAT